MSIYSRFGGFFTGEGAIRMDEFEKNVVSFDNLDEEGYGTVSVDYKIKFDRFFSRRNILEIEVKPS